MYLQIQQLNKKYGTKQVVSNVDLTMAEGEILSLLGPSGCGKTTILRMIAGLVTPDSGIIQVGERIFYDGKREIAVEDRQIGMVFQDFALWPHMTVAKNIAFGLHLRRTPAQKVQKRVEELLELVNLPGLGSRFPYQLSGGQQQRVAVARALVTEPRLLLLDEPFSSLDAGLRETMRTELVQLFRRLKITAINVTHDQDEAMSMSDRIMVLRDGQVQQVGSPIELYLHPANIFVASFMGPANLLFGEILPTTTQANVLTLRLDSSSQEEHVMEGQFNTALRSQLNGRGCLLFRPEDVQVYQDKLARQHTNVLKGTVSHTSFVGGQWRTLVSLPDSQAKQVLTFPPFQPSVNQNVWLELPPERCQIVPE